MVVDDIFCRMGRVLEEWEQAESTVHAVRVSDISDVSQDGAVSAEVDVSIPVTALGATIAETDVSETGTLAVDLETAFPIVADDGVEFDPIEATLDAEGRLQVTLSGTVGTTAHDDSPARRSHSDEHASEDGDVAPFRDSELLAEVYESNDTFAEMADALDMDVTGETVRRYMIDFDIHEPNSYSKSGEGPTPEHAGSTGEEDTIVLSDGIGLPEEVNVETLIESVNDANTIFEVKEDLDMERKEAHQMLKDLDLVSVVMGRIGNDGGDEMTRDDIVEHLRSLSARRQPAVE
jgi:hypothetical protein